MSGKDEMSYARQRRIKEEERVEEEQQRYRRHRNTKIKRWTGKLIAVVLTLLALSLLLNAMWLPVEVTTHTTAVTGEGNFDKIVINRGLTGNSNTKKLLVILEVPDNEYIAVPTGFGFYNSSIDFFITTHIEGSAQPSEHFILRTEGTTTITCKNNISISLVFGVIENVTLPFIEASTYFGLATLFAGSIIIVLLGWIIWLVVNDKWH